MEIPKEIKVELNSFELSELQRILEAAETQEYYYSGYKNLCGSYASAEAYELDEDGGIHEDTQEPVDMLEFELISGVDGEGHSTQNKSCHKISRAVIGDHDMSLKEKLQAIAEV
jgi:hypothetical protein